MAPAAAEPSMAARPETAGRCTLGMMQGKGTPWASFPLLLSVYRVPVPSPH